ncbi:hypothetical protein [Amycolatopsis saalfeldensis]|uniref:PPE family protein n=1 Tax=Amycolatopsis saalfeldensis TaxID=394193 RepID=A0A1H8YPP1_9PSEU|nr:hypothetical protein [Amycolatopsis saalfeldensis]SEP54174.1 hypothetical protein SAMN04489732_13828 [Amycolatopsis saalfeldensis]
MGAFDFLGDGTQWLLDRYNDAETWVDDLFSGNLGDQAVPAPELVQKVMSSKGAPEWHQGAATASDLSRDHSDISSRVQQLNATLESVWTGGGADAARAKIKPLADVSAAAAGTFTANSQNVTGIAHGFDEMKASLQPMPTTPPHKDFVDVATPWDTDTEDQINQYNQTAQQNLDRYNGYANQAQTSGQQLKIDYRQLADFDGGKVTITQQTTPPASTHQTAQTTGSSSHTASNLSWSPSSHTGASTPVTSAGHVGGAATSPSSQQGDGVQAAGYVPLSLANPGAGSNYVPASLPNASGGAGGGSSWSAPGLVGAFGSGSGSFNGSNLGGGPGGDGPGARGSGTSERLGSGAGTGAGEEGATRGPAGSAGRGAAGGRGSSGMGGMGAGGGKGKGEEDKEHQRKYGIDDDSAFTLVDDEGGKLLDPHTGLPPTPPTIGA